MLFSGLFSADKFAVIKKRGIALAKLYVERTKLTLADRLTLLMGAIIMIMVCVLLCIIGLIFISGALIEVFSQCISPLVAWFMVGGCYILLALLIVLFRKPLIFNPTARFVSKLIFKDDGFDEVVSDKPAKTGENS